MHPEVLDKCRRTREASKYLGAVSTTHKNRALEKIALALEKNTQPIIESNNQDLAHLEKSDRYTNAFKDRLLLNTDRIMEMASGLSDIAALDDPVGEVTRMWKRPNGLDIGLVRVPIGVIGIIYEARPNVTIDAGGLALKAGNAVVLRGSSEAINTNRALIKVVRQSLSELEMPVDSIVLVEDTDRSAALDLMQASRYLDLLIPRGGPSLINTVVENSSVPVVQTGAGNCHIYVDYNADLDKAVAITINAKVQRPGVCNALETLLVHKGIASLFLPMVLPALADRGVEIRGCSLTESHFPGIKPATEKDWETEYLDLILAVKVVEDHDQAIDHINTYGTGHSEAIITDSYEHSRAFLARVDAAAVYVNASTRFTDGAAFGLGAEMGISTQKLHVRGPMGLKDLTTLKYIIHGTGQIRE